MAGYMAARDRWCAGMARLPASTLVIVSSLASRGRNSRSRSRSPPRACPRPRPSWF